MSKKIILVIVIFSVIIPKSIFPSGITATNDWELTIDENDLLAGTGSTLISTYESNNSQSFITILGENGKDWRVDIRKSDQTWDNNFRIYARRTGGTGITGGTTYQEITDIDMYFFNGSDNKFLIPIQYRLEGVSLQIPADSYSIIIYYTLIDL